MKQRLVKFKRHVSTAILTASLVIFSRVLPALADNPDITTGLPQMDAPTFSGKILKIALGVGALDGVFAAAVLIFLAMKLKSVGQKERMETLDHLKWLFIAMGLVGLACAIVGFFAYLVKGVQ